MWNADLVEARKNPEYLRTVAQAVEDFRAALVEFLELHVSNGGAEGFGIARGIAPAVFPREDADQQEIARRLSKVSRLAGLAASANTVQLVNEDGAFRRLGGLWMVLVVCAFGGPFEDFAFDDAGV